MTSVGTNSDIERFVGQHPTQPMILRTCYYTTFPELFCDGGIKVEGVFLNMFYYPITVNILNYPGTDIFGAFRKRNTGNNIVQMHDLGYLAKIIVSPRFYFISSVLQDGRIMNFSNSVQNQSGMNQLMAETFCNFYCPLYIPFKFIQDYFINEKNFLKKEFEERIDYYDTLLQNIHLLTKKVEKSCLTPLDLSVKGLATDGFQSLKVGNEIVNVHKFKQHSANSFIEYFSQLTNVILSEQQKEKSASAGSASAGAASAGAASAGAASAGAASAGAASAAASAVAPMNSGVVFSVVNASSFKKPIPKKKAPSTIADSL
jgi:hypothetical protein